jgi:hypothetical protein
MGTNPANESPTSEMGPRQIYVPRRVKVAILAAAGGAGGVIKVACKLPDSRLRVRFDLVASPDAASVTPNAMLTGRGITIWPYGAVDDEVQGRPRIPVSEVIPGITFAAQDPVPHSAGLGGWSREFNSAADAIEALITIPLQAPNVNSGTLWLQARVQPNDFAIVPWEQWEEIRRACGGLDVLQGPIIT